MSRLLRPRAPCGTRSSPGRCCSGRPGVVVFLLPLLIGRISILRLRRRAEPITDPAILALAATAKAHLGLTRSVSLLVSPRRPVPMMWGIFRPTLLLPAEAARWSAERLWVVLLHEFGTCCGGTA